MIVKARGGGGDDDGHYLLSDVGIIPQIEQFLKTDSVTTVKTCKVHRLTAEALKNAEIEYQFYLNH